MRELEVMTITSKLIGVDYSGNKIVPEEISGFRAKWLIKKDKVFYDCALNSCFSTLLIYKLIV
jgi:hypothetical protein